MFPSTDHPSMNGTNWDEEDDEADLIDKVLDLGMAAFAGDLRGEDGDRTVLRLGFRGRFPERGEGE